MRRFGKGSFKTAIDTLEVWAVAPSCWNQIFPRSNLSIRGRRNSSNMFTYRSEFTVTVTSFSSKNQGPTIPVEEIAHHTVSLGECKGLWCHSQGSGTFRRHRFGTAGSAPSFRHWTFRRRTFRRQDYRAPELFFWICLSVATLFRFVARFARVRIEDSSRNRFTLDGIQGIACFIVFSS